MSRFRRSIAVVVTAVVTALVAAAPAVAQPGPIDSPVRLEFTVSGGALVPTSTLANLQGFEGVVEAELSENFAFGGGVGLLLPAGFSLEGQLLYAPSVEVEGESDFLVPGEEEQEALLTEGEFLALTGHLVYRFPIPILKPFVGAGAGIKRLSFDQSGTFGSESETDFAGSLLAGAYLELIPTVAIRAEARDYLSSFDNPFNDESELQHDLAFLAGLSFRVP